MKYFLLALALASSAVHAAVISLTFNWPAAVSYADGTATTPPTPLPAADIAGYTIYDGDVILTKTVGNVTKTPPVSMTINDCRAHVFTVSVTSVAGLESSRSAAKVIALCAPMAPTTLFIGM